VVLQAVYNQSYLNSVALKGRRIGAATARPAPAAGSRRTRTAPPTGVCAARAVRAFVAGEIPLPEGRAMDRRTVRKFVGPG